MWRNADERNIVYRFLRQALTEGKITYTGTGDEQREYIHVEDAALASVEILKKEYKNKHFILTGQQSLKMVEFLTMIQEIMGNKISLEFDQSITSPHYRMTPYFFNPSAAKKLTMNMHTDLGQGLLNYLSEIHQSLHEGKDA